MPRKHALLLLVVASALPATPLALPRLRSQLKRSFRLQYALRGGAQPIHAVPATDARSESFVQRKLIAPLKAVMQHGVSEQTLKMSLAVGATCGVFPVPLTTWAVTILANAAMPALNPLAMQLSNSVVTPLMVPLFPVFVRMSALVRGGAAAEISFGAIKDAFSELGFLGGLQELRAPLLSAVMGWALLTPLLLSIFYVVFMHPARKIAERYAPAESAAVSGAVGRTAFAPAR